MTRRPLQDLVASVHQRLLNKARETGRPFNEILQYFAMERFLYRLSRSPHAEKFILKGALMFTVWRVPFSRSTMDIDLLGRLNNDIGSVVAVMRDVCLQKVPPDGIGWDAASLAGERIAEGADYEGVRVRLRGSLGTARVTIQLDVGFGDPVIPSAVSAEYPTILDFPAPRVRGYSRESAIAEKLQAMTKLGLLNSRMKDFFDIWLLSHQFAFDGPTLTTAIRRTFARRGTAIQPRPLALTDEFARDTAKAAQWRAFLRRNRLENVPHDLHDAILAIAGFLEPVLDALGKGQPFRATWPPCGPWS